VNAFLSALMFLTRLPVGRWVRYDPADLARGTVFFPAVGAIVGLLSASALLLFQQCYSPLLSSAVALGVAVLVTSAFHEDGLADSADGFGGGWNREQILDILHDSRIGTYGAVALWFGLTIKLLAMAEIATADVWRAAAAIIVAHAAGRATSLWLIYYYPYVTRSSDPPKPFAASVDRLRLLIGIGFTLLLAGVLLRWPYALAVLPAVPLTLLAGLYFHRKLGGITGDALGATNSIVEALVLFAVAGL
jgi:adenosylcobinamide-GDP ribazoletransferase